MVPDNGYLQKLLDNILDEVQRVDKKVDRIDEKLDPINDSVSQLKVWMWIMRLTLGGVILANIKMWLERSGP
jgi:hypothetical protein